MADTVPDAKSQQQLEAIKSLISELGERLDINAFVSLWDGSRVPLGKNASGPLEIGIASPGTIGALLRWPTLDNIIRHYVEKKIDLRGGTLIDFGRQLNRDGRSVKVRGLEAVRLARKLAPFLLAPSDNAADQGGFDGEITGRTRKSEDNKDYIQFHYDLSNEFYALFLDPEMVYSCAYFTDWANTVDQAQSDKLEMICRKLRLKPGDRMLDVGAGWGGLLCHAATKYGVTAHGITLSEEQLAFAKEKAERLGISDRVTFELADYSVIGGQYDKIASIGMYEHIGLKNIPAYMQKMRSLLSDDGLFLNHAISKRAPKPSILRRRMRPEQRAIAKYIFPGGELDDIGHTLVAMERAGFEVHDVEAWRLHYARTCEIWCDRLTERKAEALNHVSEEKYRIWVAYLAGVSLAFSRGTLRLYQTLVSKTPKRPPPLPPTRADLYR
ncbi:MAG: cyclopropane-fatty-acyl-phospholipid synthase family protein [Pseudomonadota bacterium]